MNTILIVLFIIISIFLINKFSAKIKYNKKKKSIIKNWGKGKINEYFNFNSISRYFNLSNVNSEYQKINDTTFNDLDLEEVFEILDRTSSKIGQQYFYSKIRTIKSISELKETEKLTDIFQKNESLRVNSQLLLSNLNSYESYDLERLLSDNLIEKPRYLKYIYLLSLCSILSIVIGFIFPISFLLLIPLFFINFVFHYKNKGNILIYVNGIVQLTKAIDTAKQLSKYQEIEKHFKDFTFLKTISEVKSKTKFIGFEKTLGDDVTSIAWSISELIKIQFLIEYIFFFQFIDSVREKRESIHNLFIFLGEIDSCISIASIKTEFKNICKPNFTKESQLNVKNIYHPLIENCIPNSIVLNNKSLLLTGSNMSGKTTFIRSIAINTILAQTLNICFAEEYNAPYFRVYSSIRVSDDLLTDTSYYLNEVLAIKEFIDNSKSNKPCLFILDEIFKGTNTIERISGGKGILSYLNRGSHTVMVSTHDIELTEILKDEYDLYHFTEKIENEKLEFDYKIKKGSLKTRNAIRILELYGYPKEIIEEARNIEKNNFG